MRKARLECQQYLQSVQTVSISRMLEDDRRLLDQRQGISHSTADDTEKQDSSGILLVKSLRQATEIPTHTVVCCRGSRDQRRSDLLQKLLDIRVYVSFTI